MRIQILGDNDCAGATRVLLAQAGFEVVAESATCGAPNVDYTIGLELAARHSLLSITCAPPEIAVRGAGATFSAEPAPLTAFPPQDKPASGHEEAFALTGATSLNTPRASMAPTANASLPATVLHGERDREIPRYGGGELLATEAIIAPMAKRQKQTAGAVADGLIHAAGTAIWFDSAEGCLETAVMRHVAQLWNGPVVVERAGGRVHDERTLRIITPQEDAAVAAVKFGVLRGMLDIAEVGKQAAAQQNAEEEALGKDSGGVSLAALEAGSRDSLHRREIPRYARNDNVKRLAATRNHNADRECDARARKGPAFDEAGSSSGDDGAAGELYAMRNDNAQQVHAALEAGSRDSFNRREIPRYARNDNVKRLAATRNHNADRECDARARKGPAFDEAGSSSGDDGAAGELYAMRDGNAQSSATTNDNAIPQCDARDDKTLKLRRHGDHGAAQQAHTVKTWRWWNRLGFWFGVAAVMCVVPVAQGKPAPKPNPKPAAKATVRASAKAAPRSEKLTTRVAAHPAKTGAAVMARSARMGAITPAARKTTAHVSPTAAQLAAWRVAFAAAREPQGQQAGGPLFDSVYDSGNAALKMNCVVGCSATSGFSDNSAFSVGATSINVLGGYYTSGAAPAITSGNAGRVRMDSNSYLYVDCVTGCSASAGFGDNSAFTVGTTAITNLGAYYTSGADPSISSGNNGRLRMDAHSYLLVDGSQVTQPVSGTFWQATQPVSIATMPTTPVTGTFWQATQPISAASLPLPSGAAISAAQCGWQSANPCYQEQYDGTNVIGTATHPVQVSLANTAANSTAVKVDGSGATQPVSGTVTANAGTGTFTVGQSTGANLHVDVDSAPTTTVTGSVTANLGTLNGAATSANQCGASSGSACFGVGTMADNGQAAATDRVNVLPGIAENNYPSAETAGRNSAQRHDLQGNQLVSQMPEASFASYEASGSVALASSATDIAVLSGNATNTVMVTRVTMTCTAGTAGINLVQIIKRSSADTTGTSSNLTAVAMDSGYAAASSVAKVYTASPGGLGTVVGNIDVTALGMMATSTASPNDIYVLNLWNKPVVLRGTAQQLAINLNGATIASGACYPRFEWIETTGL